MRASVPVLFSAGLLAAVMLYEGLTGGDMGLIILFLGITVVSVLATRIEPRSGLFILGGGMPLTILAGPDLVRIFLVCVLLFGLFLGSLGFLRSRRDLTAYAGGILLTLLGVSFFPLLQGILPQAILLFGIAGVCGGAIYLFHLRLLVHCREGIV